MPKYKNFDSYEDYKQEKFWLENQVEQPKAVPRRPAAKTSEKRHIDVLAKIRDKKKELGRALKPTEILDISLKYYND